MVEHLLVIDIIACNFLPIAQYKSLHYITLYMPLRWMGMQVQSQANFYIYYYTFEFQVIPKAFFVIFVRGN